MASKDKLLRKIRNGKRNVRMRDLLNLMQAFDFAVVDKIDGYIFKHSLLKTDAMVNVAKPHRAGDKVLVVYVDQCLEAIELLQEREFSK